MGITLNERLGKIHFWTMFIAFNSTFMPLFAVGLLGQPRRVFEYAAQPADAERLGVDLRVLPRRLDAHLHLQLRDVHGGLARAGAAEPVAGARPGVAGLLAAAGRQLRRTSRWCWRARTSTATRTPCPWRTCIRRPGVIGGALREPAGEYHHEHRIGGVERMAEITAPGSGEAAARATEESGLLPRGRAQRGLDGQQAGASARCRSCSARSRSPTSTCSPSNGHGMWLPSSTRIPSQPLRRGDHGPDRGQRPHPDRRPAADQGGPQGTVVHTALVALVFGLVAVALQIVRAARPAVPAWPVRFRQRLRRVLPGGARHLAGRHDLAGDPRRSRAGDSRPSPSWSSRPPTRRRSRCSGSSRR